MFFLQFSFSNIVLFRRLRCREKIRLLWNKNSHEAHFITLHIPITTLNTRRSYSWGFHTTSISHQTNTLTLLNNHGQKHFNSFNFLTFKLFLAFKAFLIQSSVSSVFHFIAFWQNLFSSKWFPRFLCLLNCVVLPTLILILLAPQSFYNGLSYPCAMFSSETRP